MDENEILKLASDLRKYKTWVPPGHPYSPLPSKKDVLSKAGHIFRFDEGFYGIDMNVRAQIDLLESMKRTIAECPFEEETKEGWRYYFNNPLFGHADAMLFYGLIRRNGPSKIIEIGTGFSTAMMLDVNDRFFERDIEIDVIEAFPGSISEQLKEEKGLNFINKDLYDIDLSYFQQLQPNDILFIDSSHVSKAGSDVNYIIHKILPLLEAGVYVHFHDILANFDYPLEWISEGRAWNEAYILRAFLMFNDVFEVVAFNSYLGQFHKEWLSINIPGFLKNTGGSFWIKKVK